MTRKTFAIFLALALTLTAVPAAFAASDGKAIYKAKCAMCHADDGSGDTKMGKTMKLRHLGSPEVQKQTDKELYAWTADGKGKMPGYKNKLSEEDINALVAFMRTLAKK